MREKTETMHVCTAPKSGHNSHQGSGATEKFVYLRTPVNRGADMTPELPCLAGLAFWKYREFGRVFVKIWVLKVQQLESSTVRQCGRRKYRLRQGAHYTPSTPAVVHPTIPQARPTETSFSMWELSRGRDRGASKQSLFGNGGCI